MHDVLQMPLQQISPLPVLQSVDCVQLIGHEVYFGFKHRPVALRLGSLFCTVVQQISPLPVLQSVLCAHFLGHELGGRQMGWS